MSRFIVSKLDASFIGGNIQIITPNSAIAHYIRRATNSQLKISHYSLETLTQNIVRRRGIKIASTLLSRRLLQNAVREIIATKDIEGTAKAFLPTIKDLLSSGIDLKTLQQNSDCRIQQLSNLAIAYQQQLRQRKCIDAAELYWQGSIDAAYQSSYLFYGYFAPRKDELAVINAIAGKNSVLVLPDKDLSSQNQEALKWLESQGWRLLKSEEKNEVTKPALSALNVFPNLKEEVRGVLTQVKVLLTQGVEAKDIVLVTNDEQLYGETIIDVAWEYNIPVRVAYEISLEQTRMGAWLKLLLEVIQDNFPFEATAKLLSHPLSKCMSPEIWLTAKEKHPQGRSAWQELGIDLSLLNFEQNSYSRGVWLRRLQEIIVNWDILERGKGWATETVAYYRIQETLAELSQPEAQAVNRSAFIREINEILALLTIPASSGRGGIELYNPKALLGTNYPYVFALGSAEGILPKAIADDPVLDFYSRKQLLKQGLEIETATDIARREAFYFQCLLDIPTQQISFSYPELIDRDSTLPSPYLTRLGLKPTPVDTLPLPSIESARRAYLRQLNLLDEETKLLLQLTKIIKAWEVEAQRESPAAPNEYDGVVGIAIDPEGKIFSASQLTNLGQCPFKWFSRRLLKLKELTEAESDLSPASRGNLYHRCLELCLKQIETTSDLAKFDRQQLERVFAIVERELNLTKLPGWDIQRQEHLNLLAQNLTNIEFLPPEREVIATETKFSTKWNGLQIQGQVDRIDRTNEGLTVIDYKTSGVTPAGVKDETGKANIDLQLAIYQDAIAKIYPDATINTAAYYSLTKQKTISPQKDPSQLTEFARRVQSHLEKGHYPVAPDIDRKACRYCNYDPVCRKGNRLDRKSINNSLKTTI